MLGLKQIPFGHSNSSRDMIRTLILHSLTNPTPIPPFFPGFQTEFCAWLYEERHE
jgi:hypothetical protein